MLHGKYPKNTNTKKTIMKTKQTRRIILMITIALISATSCTKEIKKNNLSWNAVAFTESDTPEFRSFMNQPYINITYPSSFSGESISYINGEWTLSGFKYVFSAHNWGDEKITLKLIKNGEPLISSEIVPEPSTPRHDIKQFSFTHEIPPGKYTIDISIHDNRGITQLNRYTLHSGQDYFEVH